MIVPSLAVLLTAGAAALLGEQIRKALDPTGIYRWPATSSAGP